jgi:hypothetical protein
MKRNLWILSSQKQPYTNGDWLGTHGELKVDDILTQMLGGPLRVLRIEATRDGKTVEVFLCEKQARELASGMRDAFGLDIVDADTIKRIEKLETENANLRKALVMWAQNPPTQIHDSITLETPSEEIAKTVANAIQNDWREKSKNMDFGRVERQTLGMQVHRELEKRLTKDDVRNAYNVFKQRMETHPSWSDVLALAEKTLARR